MSKNPVDHRCQPRIIPKGWGREIVLTNQMCDLEADTCGMSGKILEYDKAGNQSSMHFHIDKSEYFYVLSGSFRLGSIDPITGNEYSDTLCTGDLIYLGRGTCHQITAIEANSKILEIATHDKVYDSVRVRPGDSQNANPTAQKLKHS